ncbi:hypothetical protein Hypma_008398 [Hypsizygus marmoreus]|uniref:Uncharacterized protein n=1 Tax=Hypsizygus marmoreus TaxID=39966 RepID=A0A369JRA6_HYPMA|nr:hypothetical protein Hypma_008398 [Hypsizygus marmoreus]
MFWTRLVVSVDFSSNPLSRAHRFHRLSGVPPVELFTLRKCSMNSFIHNLDFNECRRRDVIQEFLDKVDDGMIPEAPPYTTQWRSSISQPLPSLGGGWAEFCPRLSYDSLLAGITTVTFGVSTWSISLPLDLSLWITPSLFESWDFYFECRNLSLSATGGDQDLGKFTHCWHGQRLFTSERHDLKDRDLAMFAPNSPRLRDFTARNCSGFTLEGLKHMVQILNHALAENCKPSALRLLYSDGKPTPSSFDSPLALSFMGHYMYYVNRCFNHLIDFEVAPLKVALAARSLTAARLGQKVLHCTMITAESNSQESLPGDRDNSAWLENMGIT